jgi:phenylacetate-CoA ligase
MKGRTEEIYHSLPVFIQNIGISLFGLQYYKRRFGGVFKSELDACKKREFNTEEQWKQYQEQELRSLLVHSFETVPYYRSLFDSIPLTLEDLRNFKLSEIHKLPILEKRTFRLLGASEMLSEKPEPNGKFVYTSGSSGTPLKIMYSERMHQKYFGIYETTVRNWAGLDYSMGRGVIGGRRILKDGNASGPFYRYNFVEKQVYLSAYHISPKNAANYLEGLVKYKVVYLEGYASSLYFLARAIEDAGLKAPKLKAILTSTDKLTPEIRNAFRRVFNCEAFDSYNGVDLCNLIAECDHHRLHIVPDVGIVELYNEKGEPCKPGEVGELVSTGLLNFDQPLIRYKIGDLVKLSEDQNCTCGRHMPVVDEIVGRIEDIVIGPDGREMRRFNRIFIDIAYVLEGQVVQHEIDKFEIKLVVSATPNESDIQTIKNRMISQLGEIKVQVNVVDSIPRGPNGKFKAVISHVNKK